MTVPPKAGAKCILRVNNRRNGDSVAEAAPAAALHTVEVFFAFRSGGRPADRRGVFAFAAMLDCLVGLPLPIVNVAVGEGEVSAIAVADGCGVPPLLLIEVDGVGVG